MADDQTAQPAGSQRAGNRGNGNDGESASLAPANGIGLEALKDALSALEANSEDRIAEVYATVIPDPIGSAAVEDITLQYSRPRVLPTDENPYAITISGVKIKI